MMINITNTIKANVDEKRLSEMAFRIKASTQLSLHEVEKTLNTLTRDIENLSEFSGVDNKALLNRVEYSLRQLKQGRNSIEQIEKFYTLAVDSVQEELV